MLCLVLSMLRQEGNEPHKVFSKCYELLVGWMHPTYQEGDPELRNPPPSSHPRLELLAAGNILLRVWWVVFV